MASKRNLGITFSKPSLLIVILLFAISSKLNAQSRVFASFGGTTSLGGNFTTFTAKVPTSWSAEVELDKKVLGSLYVVTGLSTFGLGYSVTQSLLVPSNSNYTARYLALPIMARWNVGNRNFCYVDLGINTMYLAQAHLSESIDKFNNGNLESFDGNIAPYLNRFYQSFKFQETLALNRFSFSIFFIAQFKGQGTIHNLSDHWGLNPQQSTFLNSNGYSDFYLAGIKLSCRIR
jgi:hypothetical protein